MEEIIRSGAIHRICIKNYYSRLRKSLNASSAEDRAFFRGMACAYDYISDLFVYDLKDLLSIAYKNGKSK